MNEEHDEPFVVKESVMQYSDKNDRRALLQATCWSRLAKPFVCLEDAKPYRNFFGTLGCEPVYPRNYTESEEKGGHQCWVKSDFDVHDPGLIVTDSCIVACRWCATLVSHCNAICWFQDLVCDPKVTICSLEDQVM